MDPNNMLLVFFLIFLNLLSKSSASLFDSSSWFKPSSLLDQSNSAPSSLLGQLNSRPSSSSSLPDQSNSLAPSSPLVDQSNSPDSSLLGQSNSPPSSLFSQWKSGGGFPSLFDSKSKSTSRNNEVAFEYPPFLKVFKDGHVERMTSMEYIPPSLDLLTGVASKDVKIDVNIGVSARIYHSTKANQQEKRPLLIYYHGGGFAAGSAFSPMYHYYLNKIVAAANLVAVSVEYKLAPEHPVPVCYDDSWAALQWVASASAQEEWLTNADLSNVFLAGDSAGANIAHDMALRAGVNGYTGLTINGIALIHPYFGGTEQIGSEKMDPRKIGSGMLWKFVCPTTQGSDDPLFNPIKDPNFSKLGCKRVLVCVAGQDILRDRGRLYYEALKKGGWNGTVELTETPGEGHVFHLFNPMTQKAKDLNERVASFMRG